MKVDIHTHPCSRDALLGLKALRRAHERGIVVAITDHNSVECLGKAKALLPTFIPGVELSTAEGHLLLLFVEEVPKTNMTVEEAIDFAHERGGIAVAPHPFDPFRSSLGIRAPHLLEKVDGLELNQKAPAFANTLAAYHAEKLQKPLLAGSDAHLPWEVGLSYTEVEGLTPKALLKGKPHLGQLPLSLRLLRLPSRLWKALRL